MKKLAFFIVVLLCFGFIQKHHVSVLGIKGSGADYSDITFWWRCEALDFSGTNGTDDFSAGDDTGTVASSAAINTDAVKYGTNGLDIPSASDSVLFAVSSDDIIDSDEGRIGFWLYINTWVNDGRLAEFRTDSSNRCIIAIDGGDELDIYWRDGGTVRTAFASTDANLSTSTWYFIEFAWKVSTNYREFFVDGVSKGSASDTIGSWADTGFYAGGLGSAASDLYLDNIMVSNDSTRNFNALKDLTSYPN